MDKNKQFQQIQNFNSNMKDKHPGVSNIYIFESVDENGNVTDTKYGMNLLTNKGFNDIYKAHNTFALSSSVKLYVGSGVSNFDKTTSSIETPLFGGLAATNSNVNKDYAYPIIFSRGEQSNTGIITLISRFGIVYYDYNIANYDTDTLIAEYGIGTGINSLWTHSHIYNDRGEKSQITKKKNERLYIYIYMCMSLYEHVIMNGWSNNIFMAITSNQIMYQSMFESSLYTYKRNNILVDRSSGKQHTYNDVLTEDDIRNGIDSIIRNTTTMNGFTLWSQEGNDHGYIDGFVYKAPGTIVINPEYLPQKETFTITDFKSDNILTPTGFSDRIGKTVTSSSLYNKNIYPTFTSMSDVTVNTFNYHTGDWDNPCPFVNTDDVSYTNAGLETNYGLPIYYFSNNEIQTAYLYQNITPTNDILSINQGFAFMFACDKYWDQSTWINITDFNNIPQNARNCRYWITNTNSLNIVPTRATQPFELLETPNGTNGYHTYTQSVFDLYHEGSKPYVDNKEYNCLIVGGRICAINRLRSYTFWEETHNDTTPYTLWNMTYGKWLIAFRSINNSIHTVDMSTLNNAEPDISVLTVMRTLEFSTNVNSYSQTYRSESGTGWMCIQSLTSTEEAIVLNIGNTITSSLKNWKRSCCIYNTDLIAYIPTNDTTHIHIYDAHLGADVGNSIDLPTDYMPSVMFGNGNHLWFFNGTTTYHVDVSSQSRTLDTCGTNINITDFANSYKIGITYVNDVLIIYNARTTSATLNDFFYILTDTPTTITNMTAFSNNQAPSSGNINHAFCQLRYINTHSLVCVLTIGSDNTSPITSRSTIGYIIDLGRYIQTGTIYKYFINYSENFNGVYLYGESLFWNSYYLFPVVNALPLKVSGKTNTITSFNHTKHVSNKTFEIGFTNMPLWGYEINGSGKPPGSPSPVMHNPGQYNNTGEIIGWSW